MAISWNTSAMEIGNHNNEQSTKDKNLTPWSNSSKLQSRMCSCHWILESFTQQPFKLKSYNLILFPTHSKIIEDANVLSSILLTTFKNYTLKISPHLKWSEIFLPLLLWGPSSFWRFSCFDFLHRSQERRFYQMLWWFSARKSGLSRNKRLTQRFNINYKSISAKKGYK